MRRWLALFVIATIAFIDLAPALVQAQETIQLAQAKRRRTLMDMLFGGEEEQRPRRRQEQEQPQEQPRQREPRQREREPRAELPQTKPAVEKAANATRVAVFGDSLAADLAKALERFYSEDPNLLVIPQGVGSSGFVRTDFFDWEKTAAEQIAANSFDLAIVTIGINDRQELTADGKTYEPLSEGWKAAYQARLTSFLAKFRAAGKPVIWVGLPPMKSSSYSAAMSEINAIQRLASYSGGAEFVDIYERFLDDEGKYSSYGPDITGQSVRIRKDDGIHFSTAGADKLAFFLNQSIKLFYQGGGITVEVADPLLGTDAGTMVRLPFQGQGQIRMLEVAGAVIPLSNTPPRAGDLMTAETVPGGGQSFELDQLMQAPAGRADAFGVGIDPAAEPDAEGAEGGDAATPAGDADPAAPDPGAQEPAAQDPAAEDAAGQDPAAAGGGAGGPAGGTPAGPLGAPVEL